MDSLYGQKVYDVSENANIFHDYVNEWKKSNN